MTANQLPSYEVALRLKIMRFSTKKEIKISRPFLSHYFHHYDVWIFISLPQGRAGQSSNKMMPFPPPNISVINTCFAYPSATSHAPSPVT